MLDISSFLTSKFLTNHTEREREKNSENKLCDRLIRLLHFRLIENFYHTEQANISDFYLFSTSWLEPVPMFLVDWLNIIKLNKKATTANFLILNTFQLTIQGHFIIFYDTVRQACLNYRC